MDDDDDSILERKSKPDVCIFFPSPKYKIKTKQSNGKNV